MEQENGGLRVELNKAYRQIKDMQETMREWVASQYGLMALAKALKDEVETCPNKEHHKLNSLDARKDIAEATADASYDANESATVNEIPSYP